MGDLYRELWARAECEEPVFSSEEIEWAPPSQFETLCRLRLLREAERATWARCDACGDAHVEEVGWLRNATTGECVPFVPCPEAGAAPIAAERLRRWAMDFDVLAHAVREGLNLIGDSRPLVAGRVWALGRRHVAGRYRDFFLAVGVTGCDAPSLWERCRQIEDAPAAVLLVPSSAPVQARVPTLCLTNLAAISESGINFDLDYLADLLPRDRQTVAAKTITSFAVPDGATWGDLQLAVREHSLLAEIRGDRREFDFDDLGLSGPEDRLWQVLCALARLGGQTPARSRSASEKDAAAFRKQVSKLRQLLSTVFPIAGEPIQAVHGTGGYRCLFQISLDRRDGFPVKAERWDDCRFVELRDGHIAISVRTKEVFAAKAVSEETLRRTAIEVAERLAVRTEEYDLRTLGLADKVGNPTTEGRVLLEFLRNGGKLLRRGDDKDLLRLAQRLRAWMGIDEAPFQFSASRRMWSTAFECGSHPINPC